MCGVKCVSIPVLARMCTNVYVTVNVSLGGGRVGFPFYQYTFLPILMEERDGPDYKSALALEVY